MFLLDNITHYRTLLKSIETGKRYLPNVGKDILWQPCLQEDVLDLYSWHKSVMIWIRLLKQYIVTQFISGINYPRHYFNSILTYSSLRSLRLYQTRILSMRTLPGKVKWYVPINMWCQCFITLGDVPLRFGMADSGFGTFSGCSSSGNSSGTLSPYNVQYICMFM